MNSVLTLTWDMTSLLITLTTVTPALVDFKEMFILRLLFDEKS